MSHISSSQFASIQLRAEQRYPFTAFHDENQEIGRLREQYIVASRRCISQPEYYAMSNAGYLPCSCEPWMLDDIKGWQTIKHTRARKVRSKFMHDYKYDDEYA